MSATDLCNVLHACIYSFMTRCKILSCISDAIVQIVKAAGGETVKFCPDVISEVKIMKNYYLVTND